MCCVGPLAATALILAGERSGGCGCGCGCDRQRSEERQRSQERRCSCGCGESRGAGNGSCEAAQNLASQETERRRCEAMADARAQSRENCPCTSDVLRPAATCWSTPLSSCR